MKNNNGSTKIIGLIIVFIIVVLAVGGLIYLDSTGKLSPQNNDDKQLNNNNQADTQTDNQPEVNFVTYQAPDGLYQLQIPDFWVGEERNGAVLLYSYNPVEGEPAQRMKIEIGKAPNADKMTADQWMQANNIDLTNAQSAVLTPVAGQAIIEDNTEKNPNDIQTTIYMPINDFMYIITAASYGQIRDVAIQYFNYIISSWQWSEGAIPVEVDNQPSVIDLPNTYQGTAWTIGYPADWTYEESDQEVIIRSLENSSLPFTIEVLASAYEGSITDWIAEQYELSSLFAEQQADYQNPYVQPEQMQTASLDGQDVLVRTQAPVEGYTATQVFALKDGIVYKLSFPDSNPNDEAFADKFVNYQNIINTFKWQQ